MLIRDIGGEFNLINRLDKIIPSESGEILVGIGDDAAVIKTGHDDDYLLVTTDTLVANDHFNTAWSKPQQIGKKTVECNVSDIAAMGGRPTLMFVSLVLTPDTTVDWVENVYQGMAESCREHKVIVAGGDTTHGPVETISITLLGKVSPENLCLRSQAIPGDILAVTGLLGGSTAGLNLLRNNMSLTPYLKEKHLTPRCRLDAAQQLAPIVNAMIDISDGLASEVNHICSQSKVGAIVNSKDVPLHRDVIDAGKKLDIDPLNFALNGGEDFELLFSIPKENLKKLNDTGLNYHIVGEVTDAGEESYLITSTGGKVLLKGGYNHFE